jgi:hypothetical protein
MRALLPVACVALAMALGCATGASRLERYRALSQQSRDDFDKYHQFMTERQQERFFECPSDEQRRAQIAALHIEERLARYPEHIQKAIWSQQVVPGMDREAVLLTWGKPESVERPDFEDSKGVSTEIWSFDRGSGGQREVEIVQGIVTSVEGQ